jgi:hypothetical protein
MFAFTVTACLAQQTPAQQTPTAKPQITTLLAALHSEKWDDRAAAYEGLVANPTAMRNAEVRMALWDLQDRENHLTLATAPEPESEESYAEYKGQLLDTLESIVNWSDPKQLCILANASYNTDSKFAGRLAEAGKPILPCLIQMTKSDRPADRFKSVSVLIQMRAKGRNLDSETVQEIRGITIRALHDADDGVREFTVESLEDFGTEDMIPALKEVAETDPAPEVQGISTRKHALKAIEQIQQRTRK